MRWPEWLSSSTSTGNNPASITGQPARNDTSPPALPPNPDSQPSEHPQNASPQVLAACAATAAATLALTRVYRRYLQRIPTVAHLPPDAFRQRSVYGYVTSVGDGDNFRLFHTPGGRWAGWGWLPGRRPQGLRARELQERTLHVRLAGVDAPEMAHFGRPAQPYSREAVEWLRACVLRRHVRVVPYRRDQYERVVCTVYRRRWGFWRTDVGLVMLKRGLATVYEAKYGSEFGNREAEYRAAEERAKQKKIGMWQEPGLMERMMGKTKTYESPREYKTRMAKLESSK